MLPTVAMLISLWMHEQTFWTNRVTCAFPAVQIVTTPSVRFRAEACGVPAGADSVSGPPGDARIPPKDGGRDASHATASRDAC
jgi:hypothetical protein